MQNCVIKASEQMFTGIGFDKTDESKVLSEAHNDYRHQNIFYWIVT